MKRILAFSTLFCSLLATGQQLAYYLPAGITYNSAIPTPASVIGHEVGAWHITHDRLVYYMQAVAAASPRVTLTVTGTTHEGRPQLALFITSPANHGRLEQIREQHLQLTNPDKNASLPIASMPAVVWIGCSIHGNEPSGSNMSPLLLYHLAAAQGPAIEELLERTVIILDPSFNPDGLNRFATWVNMHKSATPVGDPLNRELNEAWPGGRTNHYWFDLNRDWLPAQQPESQNRLQVFHNWRPNILTDHHEMGSNSSFFFQPGVPSRVNPNTPARNQELTAAIGNFHAKYLDSIGSLYFTKEGYDDFYYGKGSTFPDIHGGIGILFEQASSRGHLQQTQNGPLSFAFTIRNQFVTALSTLEAARNLREDLLLFQRDFYQQVKKDAAAFPVKAYVFGHNWDQSRNAVFLEMLRRHKIEVVENRQTLEADGQRFEAGRSWLVPTAQSQFKLVKTIFEKTFSYTDSLFYDITTWTFPLAMGIPYAELKAVPAGNMGNTVETVVRPSGSVVGTSAYAYAFEWDDFYAPRLLYALQSRGITTRVASQLFEAQTTQGPRKFNYGTILIPLGIQSRNAAEVRRQIETAAASTGVQVYALQQGLSVSGVDLGSNSFVATRTPRILLLGGSGVTSNDVGEIWHMLDYRMGIPSTLLELERFNGASINSYNIIIMADGSYSGLDKAAQEKLRAWIANGGTVLAFENAGRFLSNAGITKTLYRGGQPAQDTTTFLPYYLRSDEQRARDMPGSIFEARFDNTHPLCYGYRGQRMSIFKANTLFMDPNNGNYDAPVLLTSNPLQSGYLHRSHAEKLKGSAVVNIEQVGRGRVVTYSDNMNFRAFWLGTSKLFLNALFF
ncbi:MAG TPA: M14 family metallopeptidase [Lacibacter sp.]|nr:M14 family metallopeptidase [Lacibacter sp.]HMO89609.1 M14 family metallopeptidase [Lacibacter sp.]